MKLPRALLDLVRGSACAGLVVTSACQAGPEDGSAKPAATLAPATAPSPAPPGIALTGATGGSLFERENGAPSAPIGQASAGGGEALPTGIGSPPDVDAGIDAGSEELIDGGHVGRLPRRPRRAPDDCPGCGMG